MKPACCVAFRDILINFGPRTVSLAAAGLVCMGLACTGLTQTAALAQTPKPVSTIPSPPPRPYNLGENLPKVQVSVPAPERVPQAVIAPVIVTAPQPPVRPPSLTFTPPPSAVARAIALGAAQTAETTTKPPVAPSPELPAAATAVAALPPPAEQTFASKLRTWFTPTERPADEEEDEWPRRTPGQRGLPRTEPVFDPNEKPERPGLSTDPGVSTKCLPELLQTVLQKVIARYGAVKVTSTYRPSWRARRGSYHRRCEAVDFRVPGVRPGEVLALVKTYDETGGHKVYWNGLIHVDTGPYRTWRGARR